jgi:outer membrane lipoprotein-sorting protein
MWKRMEIVLLVVVLSAGIAFAQETASSDSGQLTAEEVVKKANHVAYYQGDDGRAKTKMTITDAQGRTRVKEFIIIRKNIGAEDGDQDFYVYFAMPPDERGTVFMVHKLIESADDDRWLYLPALDVVKRIAASDKRTSFVGSDYYYEDVSGRKIADDDHELVSSEDPYYVIKCTPKDPKAVEFDSYTAWIDKKFFVPVQMKYEKNGKVYRQMTVLAVEDIQGFKTIMRQQMEDLAAGTKTVLEYPEVKYNIGIPEDIFTERYLRNAPMEYLSK